jgi:hypothetical protein
MKSHVGSPIIDPPRSGGGAFRSPTLSSQRTTGGWLR